MASMKRSNSRSLEELLGAGQTKRGAADGHGRPKRTGSRAGSHHMRGLAGLQRSSSLGGSGATTGGGSGAVAGGGLLGEVCSPPPSKPLNFAVPPVAAQLSSPFAAAAAVTPVPPRPHGLAQQTAAAGHSSRQAGGHSDSDWSEGEEMEDQENRQPCGVPAAGTAGATQPPAANWLFSPVRPRAAAHGGSGGSGTTEPSAAAQAPAAGLFSPAPMPTPARDVGPAAPAGLPTLHHAPSFSSWMFSAARPPASASASAVDVADIVDNLTADPTAARGFGGGSPGGGKAGTPSHLDCLLAELGDTHYPSSLMQWEQEELPDSDADAEQA